MPFQKAIIAKPHSEGRTLDLGAATVATQGLVGSTYLDLRGLWLLFLLARSLTRFFLLGGRWENGREAVESAPDFVTERHAVQEDPTHDLVPLPQKFCVGPFVAGHMMLRFDQDPEITRGPTCLINLPDLPAERSNGNVGES